VGVTSSMPMENPYMQNHRVDIFVKRCRNLTNRSRGQVVVVVFNSWVATGACGRERQQQRQAHNWPQATQSQ
jgi:hypothetical protein